MNRTVQIFGILALSICTVQASAAMQFLKLDLGTNGAVRLCKYSDNKILSVEANTICPLKFDDSARSQASKANNGPAGECLGYRGPGGPCFARADGRLYAGPGGALSTGKGGGLSTGPGGGLNAGPGGGMYAGPGGGLYDGPGGGLYNGPGGGIYDGPPISDPGVYKGPWGPCITGAATNEWLRQHCPNRGS